MTSDFSHPNSNHKEFHGSDCESGPTHPKKQVKTASISFIGWPAAKSAEPTYSFKGWVADGHWPLSRNFPSILVSMFLKDDWDNIAALSKYKGPVEIFGAKDDTVIPVAHARALAASTPSSKFVLISGGHNDWSQHDRVRIRNP